MRACVLCFGCLLLRYPLCFAAALSPSRPTGTLWLVLGATRRLLLLARERVLWSGECLKGALRSSILVSTIASGTLLGFGSQSSEKEARR